MGLNKWSREELVLAFDLYCRIPFGQFHNGNPEIINLARQIGRTASAVAMKLSNFASFDTVHQSRGIQGLQHSSKADRAIWEELTGDWEKFAEESESLRQNLKLSDTKSDEIKDDAQPFEDLPTEVIRLRKVRLGQQFFRQLILSAYGSCCICGIPVPVLLIASHIVPWKDRHDLRLNPHNGLCLCALHDKAFDQGLITVNAAYEILVSPQIEQYLPLDVLNLSFMIHQGNKIRLPQKFMPDASFLDEHTSKYFLQAI